MELAEDTINQTELENMEPKAAFDSVMEHTPFLRRIIENKIKAEVADRDRKIKNLESTLDEMSLIVLDTMMMSMTRGMKE